MRRDTHDSGAPWDSRHSQIPSPTQTCRGRKYLEGEKRERGLCAVVAILLKGEEGEGREGGTREGEGGGGGGGGEVGNAGGSSMTPTRPLGSSRHALESCTLQLHTWKPFQLHSPPPHHHELPYPFPAKKPCRSDRSTAPSTLGDHLDLSRLSLLDDPHPQHQQQQRFREEGIGSWLARKRRRRRGGSRSISGRSSERSGTRRRCCSVGGGGASGAYATCSDFPVAAGGTDSSGELFMNGDGNWGSDVSEARISRRDSKDAGSGGGGLDRDAPYSAPYQGGLGALDLQGNESGYGSETGYRGDAELGYGDEFDEEEDDGRVLFWGDQLGDGKVQWFGFHLCQPCEMQCKLQLRYC
ncbi:hypothetical protein Taro_027018 [Colocasia esculenta]|uniref:Uncharacterized protein n=1 Tax=Colocasia esculenta TaxID=4460 RepID=A0A843VEJ5_COLES|nr:hypothetical protein [Colocasia esculenta]